VGSGAALGAVGAAWPVAAPGPLVDVDARGVAPARRGVAAGGAAGVSVATGPWEPGVATAVGRAARGRDGLTRAAVDTPTASTAAQETPNAVANARRWTIIAGCTPDGGRVVRGGPRYCTDADRPL
jgi:hypothetical protein